jgi:hypothetical protein
MRKNLVKSATNTEIVTAKTVLRVKKVKKGSH